MNRFNEFDAYLFKIIEILGTQHKLKSVAWGGLFLLKKYKIMNRKLNFFTKPYSSEVIFKRVYGSFLFLLTIFK